MIHKIYALVDRFFSRFTYSGKIRFVCGMVLCLIIADVTEIIYFQHDLFKMYHAQKAGLQQHRALAALLEASCDLQIASAGNHTQDNAALKVKVNQLLLSAAVLAEENKGHFFSVLFDGKLHPTQFEFTKILSLWEKINQAEKKGRIPSEDFTVFTTEIVELIHQNVVAHRLDQGMEMTMFLVSDISLVRLPLVQQRIAALATMPRITGQETGSLQEVMGMIEMERQAIAQTDPTTADQEIQKAVASVQVYEKAVNHFLNIDKQADLLAAAKEDLRQGWKTAADLNTFFEAMLLKVLNLINYRRNGTLAVNIVGFFIFLAVWLTRVMRRPLEELKNGVNALIRGDLTVQVPVRYRDEVSHIIIAFNELASLWKNNLFEAKRVTDRLVDIAATVFNIAKQLEFNVVEQTATIDSMKLQSSEITKTTQRFNAILGEVNQSITFTSSVAEKGRTSLSEMEVISGQMGDAAKLIVDTLSLINEQVARIQGVISTIVTLADQSNLLSLNTAIKANRTGITGAGFAVVAGKIREFADQIAVATLDIEKAIGAIVSDVSKAVGGVEEFSKQILEQIQDEKTIHEQFTLRIDQTQAQIEVFDRIYSDIEQQFKDSMQIDSMIQQLAKISHETGTSARKLYDDANMLNRGTQNLQKMFANFRFQ